ncbi:MAG: hypothetical protein NZ455_02340 [Bacteroidia bacterium]|nr:hypothetical protein [Bacteroidia bacterium]MDW8348572.1 hypothetical protein [Bacteroidia bacterium]
MGVPLANARVGAFRTPLSLRCYADAPHCLTACSMHLTQLHFDVLPGFYASFCFALFDIYFQILTRLNLK